MTATEETAPKVVAMVPQRPESMLHSLDEIERIAKACAASGFYKDVKDASQAIVKMLAGQELGIGPIRALSDIYIVDGRPSASANLIAANIKRSGRYDFRVVDRTTELCRLEFFEGGRSVGFSEFTLKDAAVANLAGRPNWKKYPRAMLFSRALTEGARVYCPDAAGGISYSPDELNPAIEVDATGTPTEPIDVTPRPAPPPPKDTKEGRVPPPAEEALGPQHGGALDPAAPLSKASIEKIERGCRNRLKLLVEEEENWAAMATGIVRDLGHQDAGATPEAELPLILRAISTWNPSKAAAAGSFEGEENVDQRPTVDEKQRKLLFARAAELFPNRNSYQLIHEVIEPLGFKHMSEIHMESLDDVLQGLDRLAEPGAFD